MSCEDYLFYKKIFLAEAASLGRLYHLTSMGPIFNLPITKILPKPIAAIAVHLDLHHDVWPWKEKGTSKNFGEHATASGQIVSRQQWVNECQ